MAVEKIQFAMPMAAEPEEPSLVVKAGCGGSTTKASDEPSLVVKAGPRGAGMPEPGEVDYSSDEEFDSDEDPEVSYAKICERFERRTRETLAALPWLTFESDASILKRQEYQELKRQQQEEQVYVAV